MFHSLLSRPLHCCLLFVFLLASAGPLGGAPPTSEVLEALANQQGVLVHLGCGDGTRSLELQGNGKFLVQALDRDPKAVEVARKNIHAQKRYGPVSVNVLTGEGLPFADNLINVLVVDEPHGIDRQEILRVLTPRGSAWLHRENPSGDGEWEQMVKTWPESMDEWTHFLHDASGNAVSHDTAVGPPRRLQWTCGPLWTRSHEFNNSMPAMVTAQGKMFYIFDQGLTGMEDNRLPEKWTLIARDAFNGRLLWERDLSSWGSHQWDSRALRFFRGNMARRLVADQDRVFVTFDYGKGVEILDAATGSSLGQVPETEGSEEILVEDNHLICISQRQARRPNAEVVVTCYDIEEQEVLWQYKGKGHYIAQLPCVSGDSVVYHDTKKIICINREDGSVRWETPSRKSEGSKDNMLLIAEGKVLVSSLKGIQALSLESGKVLWQTESGPKTGSMREYDMFVAGGKVFANAGASLIAGYDLATGDPTLQIDPTSVQSQGHHLRCYRAKATEDFLITQFRGVEFLSLNEGGAHTQNDWLRGSCTYGVMPANGFLYQPPHSCFCYAGAMQKGFNAFSSPPLDEDPNQAVEDRPGPLEKGPAYGARAADQEAGAQAWTAYRHDERRTGGTANRVHGPLDRRWKVDLGTPTTPPVAAHGRIYVSAKEHHTIYALDAATGNEVWSFLSGGPVDSAPTIHGGLIVFGCSDGYAYCLRAEDGALAWRRRLAPAERWMADNGILESVWPRSRQPAGRRGTRLLRRGSLQLCRWGPLSDRHRCRNRGNQTPYESSHSHARTRRSAAQ